jgi:hypothetical protein
MLGIVDVGNSRCCWECVTSVVDRVVAQGYTVDENKRAVIKVAEEGTWYSKGRRVRRVSGRSRSGGKAHGHCCQCIHQEEVIAPHRPLNQTRPPRHALGIPLNLLGLHAPKLQ